MFRKDSKKILVVDDDENIRSLCREVLTVVGYDVETAAHGAEGLNKLRGTDYGLVLSDINMPELGGVEFYVQAKEEFPHLNERFIFFTGNVTWDLERMSRREGIKCLEKPFRITELLSAVDTAMVKPIKAACGKYDLSRRREARFNLASECDIFEEDVMRRRFLLADTEDVSRNGVRIISEGEPLTPGTAVSVYISINYLSLHRSATVVWSKKAGPRRCVSGLRFNEPMPVSSIINIVPAKELRQHA